MRTKGKVVPNNELSSSTNHSELGDIYPHFTRCTNTPEISVWLALSITLLTGFLVVGVSPDSAIQIWVALLLYSLPFYFATYIWYTRTKPIDSTIRIVIGFGLGSMFLALLFGFTPVAQYPLVFWLIGIGLTLLSLVPFIVVTEQRTHSAAPAQPLSKPIISLLLIPVLVAAAALAQRISWPANSASTKWLPDDVPIFASWSENLSLGGVNNQILDGFTLKYHWLTYSFLGGFDRLFSEDFFGGSFQVAPIIAWTGLAFGALAISRLYSLSFVSSFLAVSTVLFSTTLGLLQFSRVSVGGTVVSPSHLIAASWVIVIVLLGLLIYPSSLNLFTSSTLFLILGFALALTKFSAFAVALVVLAVLSLYLFFRENEWSHTRQPFRALALSGVFLLGGITAYLLFIRGGRVDFTIDPALTFDSQMGLSTIIIQLLPLGASAFSLIVLLLPIITLSFRYLLKDPLISAAFVIAIMGLVATVILELRDANETWFIAEGMAIILPLSSVLVYVVLKNLATSRKCHREILIVLGLFALALSTFLLSQGEASALLVRPWLTPSILVLGSLVAAISIILVTYGRRIRRKNAGFLFRTIGALMVVTLFVTTIPYGVGLRATAAIAEVRERAAVSQERDMWIKGAQELAESGQFASDNSSVAIYSTSQGEETIVRWIPFLAGTRTYFLRDEDLLRYIYISTDSSEMFDRESNVRQFVENGSQSSCEALKEDGISQVWVTPNVNFDGSAGSALSEHSLIDVDCDSLE